MLYRYREAEQSLLQSDLLSHFEIIAITEEALVGQYLDLEHDLASANVHELVGSVPEALLVAIWRARLDEDVQLVESLLGIVTLALVARGCLGLTFATAGIALCLELLDEAGTESLRLHNDSLAIALGAHLDVLRVIRTCSTTMRTERIPRILDLHLFP